MCKIQYAGGETSGEEVVAPSVKVERNRFQRERERLSAMEEDGEDGVISEP